MDVVGVAEDLHLEQAALDQVVATLDDRLWNTPTPSPGWTVRDQIAHLTYFDEAASLAIDDPQEFSAEVARFWVATTETGASLDDLTLGEFRAMASSALLDRWRGGRRALAEAAATLTEDSRVNWYGPSMGAKSFLTARMMEVWAHGQDVVDALGGQRPPTDRLHHIARLGFITRGWSYSNRGIAAPQEDVYLRLHAPSGDVWFFGAEDSAEPVTGTAADFCLVVTQRRHIDDTNLKATPIARRWLLIAQAFAGPATDGPAAGSRV